jgi:DNA-binding GntR family transcriptional regulator
VEDRSLGKARKKDLHLPLARRQPILPPRPNPVTAQARGRTAATLVYRALRNDIIAMRIAPGHAINEKAVGLAHGVSRTPVREALLRLAGDGLVEIFPQSGTFVTRIPIAALPEAIMVRKALENVTVQLAAKNATDAQIDRLRENLNEQKAFVRRDDRLGFHLTDQNFHGIIADVAGHPNIWNLAMQVKVQVDRYCMLTLPEPGRMKFLIGEHAEILDAIAAHDEARAAAAIAVHLEWLRNSVRDISGLNPDFFDIPSGWPHR